MRTTFSRGLLVVFFSLVIAVLAAGCGSDSSSSSDTSGGSSTSGGSASSKPLDGKEVWYLDVLGTNPTVNGNAQGINNIITGAGGTLTRTFSLNSAGQVDISVEAQAFDRAIAAKPAAIIFFVLDPKALKPQVARAQSEGIPVFAMLGKPEGYDVNAYLEPPDCEQGKIIAQALADKLAPGSEWAELASAPIPSNEIQLDCAEKVMAAAGFHLVGNRNDQRNLTDIATGATPIMQGLLQKFPNLKGLYAFNDDSAIGAIAAIKASGKSGNITVASRNGSDIGIAAVKKGDLYATCDFDPIGLGQAMGKAVVAQVDGSKDYKDSFQLTPPDPSKCLYTKDNVADYVPWTKRVKQVDIPEG
jgi:ribose transport system substrate-binding protein